jgi:phage tail-like protein
MLRFKLIVRIQQTSAEISLPPGEFGFGRDPVNDLQIPDPRVSRRHGKFISSSEECQLVDLGSANGTFVNGEQLQPNIPATLPDRAEIKVGDAVLVLVHEEVKESAALPVESTSQRPKPSAPPTAAGAAQGTEQPPAAPEAEPPAAPPEIRAKAPAKPPAAPQKAEKPPSPPAPPPPAPPVSSPLPGAIPGLEQHSVRLIDYLPDIYRTDFISRFLALFESILLPIEWNIDNFDLYLDPETAPAGFLPWLAGWFGVPFDNTWSEEKRRLYLKEAHLIYARRGTRWALSRLLEIYTGAKPDILEFVEGKDPLYFKVRLPLKAGQVNSEVLLRLIDDHKPAHTTYEVEFAK